MGSEVQFCERETAQDTTETEIMLTSILKELLPGTVINLNEHLVGLGGDSLVAIELMDRLSKASGVTLSPVLPFESDTLQELAAQVDSIRQASREGISGDMSSEALNSAPLQGTGDTLNYRVRCPECEFCFQVHSPMVGEVVVCPDCALNLRILSIDEIEKAVSAELTETDHQDWGE